MAIRYRRAVNTSSAPTPQGPAVKDLLHTDFRSWREYLEWQLARMTLAPTYKYAVEIASETLIEVKTGQDEAIRAPRTGQWNGTDPRRADAPFVPNMDEMWLLSTMQHVRDGEMGYGTQPDVYRRGWDYFRAMGGPTTFGAAALLNVPFDWDRADRRAAKEAADAAARAAAARGPQPAPTKVAAAPPAAKGSHPTKHGHGLHL